MSFGSRRNQAIITGPGSAWNLGNFLRLGDEGSFNALRINDGGTVNVPSCYMGYKITGSDNLARVSDPDSTWNILGTLYVGFRGSFNTLLVANDGIADLGAVGVVESEPSSSGNCLTVDGGTLRAYSKLDIRRGTNVFNAGLMDVLTLVVTNTQGYFEYHDGTLRTYSVIVKNGRPFIVGQKQIPGAAPVWELLGNGSYSFANGVVLSSNATMIGSGRIEGTLTVSKGATVSPGASIGKITLSDAPVLQGHLHMKISKRSTTLTQDQIEVNGALTYGGSLTVEHLGPTALTLGNSFQLFNATSYSGSFSTVTLPRLPSGLGWTNRLSMDGSIAVVEQRSPSIGRVMRTGSNLIFDVSGGSPGGPWNQLTATNVALPLSSWTMERSGIFDLLGQASLSNVIDSAEL